MADCSLENIYIMQVFSYYYHQLIKNPILLKRVNSLFPYIVNGDTLVGISDRTLGLTLPTRKTYEGNVIRGALQRIGLFTPSGHELFRGCLVIPKIGPNKYILSAKGIRLTTNIPKGKAREIEWLRKQVQSDYLSRNLDWVKVNLHVHKTRKQ